MLELLLIQTNTRLLHHHIFHVFLYIDYYFYSTYSIYFHLLPRKQFTSNEYKVKPPIY